MDTLCNTSNTSTLPTISDKTPTPLWLYHTVSDKTSTRKTDPHGHNLFSRYHEVHLSVIEQIRGRKFIGEDTLDFYLYPNGFRLWGEISCLGNIVIKVDKFLDSTGLGKDPTVKTRWYSYNVSIRGYGNLVRYDNQDDTYLRNQHYDEHHLHIFNWVTGIENARSPYWIGDKNWPTLGQVIHNVELWYWTYKDELPSSENYSEIGARTSPPMSGAS